MVRQAHHKRIYGDFAIVLLRDGEPIDVPIALCYIGATLLVEILSVIFMEVGASLGSIE